MGKSDVGARASLSDAALERIRNVLESQRRLGPASYPLEVKRLFELAELEGKAGPMKTLAGLRPPKNQRVAVTAKRKPSERKRYFENALAFCPEDADSVLAGDRVLRWVLAAARTDKTQLFSPAQLAERVPSRFQKSFKSSLDARLRQGDLPPGIGALRSGGGFRLFQHSDVIGQPASGEATAVPAPRAAGAPAGDGDAPFAPNGELGGDDFAARFQRAFDRLDAERGGHNYVLLYDLRRELADLSRDAFDQGLNALRDRRLFTLDSHDGRHVRLAPEELEAGVREGSALLVYAARRDG